MNRFEVFLSFKNTDENGNPSKEQGMATELYDALSSIGVSVFFSNKTLPILGAAQYKTVIDEALDSAKILIAIGTSRENLTSSWVRYEWDGFYGDILSGKKHGQLFSFIDEMSPMELPRALRQLQCFERSKWSISEVGRYILNALGGTKPAEALRESPQDFSQISGSVYSYLSDKEASRLSSQARLVLGNDIDLLRPIIDELSQKNRVNVLDLGCADGYLTVKVFDSFKDKLNLVVGVDHEEACIKTAREQFGAPYHFDKVELEAESFENNLKSILTDLGIMQVDLVFCSLVLHHLTDPKKTLKKIRRFLRPGGYIYLRSCDDDEIIGYPDEDNLIRSTIQSTYALPGMSDRLHGRKLFGEVYGSGYTNIRVFPYYVSTASMGTDARMQFFFDIFYWRKNRFKYLLDKNPGNQEFLQRYNQYCENYDTIEDRFYDPSFFFKVSGPIVIATK